MEGITMKTLTIQQIPAFLRDMHVRAKFDASYEKHFTGDNWYTTYIHEMWASIVPAIICMLRGHDLCTHDGDAENGCEELSCRRCGWSETIYW
jgi:hypothetical protein